MELRLRRRYREGARYKMQKSTRNRSGTAKKKKVAAKNLPPQPKKVMVMDAATGHKRMETV